MNLFHNFMKHNVMKLYRFLYLLLLILPSTACSKATQKYKKVPVQCVYSTLGPTIQVRSVEQTDTATNVFLSCYTVPSRTVYMPRDLYLVDMQQKYYRMLSTTAVVSGQAVKCPLNGELQYMISFERMGSISECFDMLSMSSDVQTYAFWGIHGKRIKYKRHKDEYRNDKDSSWLSIGKVVVRGRFLNTGSSLLPDSFRLKNNVARRELDEECMKSRKWTHLSKDGRFEIQTVLDGVSWAYIDLPGYNLPVMLYPNDTIDLEIDNSLPGVYKTQYRSKKGNAMFTHLMQADPQLMNPLFLKEGEREPARLDELVSMWEAERKNLSDLHSYLVYKYQLSDVESHLLRLNLESEANKYYLRRLSKTVNVCHRHDTQDYVREENSIPPFLLQEIRPYLSFLKRYNHNDYSWYLLPDKESIFCLNDFPLVEEVMSVIPDRKHLIRPMLEDFMGGKFPDFWLNGLCSMSNEHEDYIRK